MGIHIKIKCETWKNIKDNIQSEGKLSIFKFSNSNSQNNINKDGTKNFFINDE